MPNFCENRISVQHPDRSQLLKFKEALEAGELFRRFIPLRLNDGSVLDASDAWGTKWDVSDGDFKIDTNENSGSGIFYTAWSPPIVAFERLSELGFKIQCVYLEEGAGYCGIWATDEIDECYEYDFDDPNWRDDIHDEEVLSRLNDEYELYEG